MIDTAYPPLLFAAQLLLLFHCYLVYLPSVAHCNVVVDFVLLACFCKHVLFCCITQEF